MGGPKGNSKERGHLLKGGERRLEEIKRKGKDMTTLILSMVELNVYYR